MQGFVGNNDEGSDAITKGAPAYVHTTQFLDSQIASVRYQTQQRSLFTVVAIELIESITCSTSSFAPGEQTSTLS
jgi:hypothetical protein